MQKQHYKSSNSIVHSCWYPHICVMEGWFDCILLLILPMAIVCLLVVGGHGGTRTQNWEGLIASVLVNTLAYTTIITALVRLRGRA
jgi:hypothetical protein